MPIHCFYAATNSIYSNSRFASEMSKMHLKESFCLPLFVLWVWSVVHCAASQPTECVLELYTKKYLHCTNESLWRSFSGGSVNVWILSILCIKGNYFFEAKSQNTVLQTCCALSVHTEESVQLCYKYNLGVTFCCSGAIVAAVCNDFRLVVFLPARRYASAGLCDSDVSVCPSVRLSHAGIVPSRAKAGSWNVYHLIAPSL